jgi:hypothetical protein
MTAETQKPASQPQPNVAPASPSQPNVAPAVQPQHVQGTPSEKPADKSPQQS